ncbi:MAG: hypothetical protein A2928_00935 [Candidatus Taylorbacteria bacterium RIFCSPLOWO2_01_FULL_45_15b]|uniref:Phosphotyrosine protein phosphatase I domain-containing protein n=1 Tax=Candidatus Taylorbacteria bacterium RIFCSPLOWO2_01_FULL_45_15b TaxID=1802319 RepID=A0A1G2NAD6_9BACT|nr:MAG: hypothetical protein A2928_00935 [Candidatus Taylorbacteria bacterium RIFCSPLOWO2_01_FULL_45_15b]
MKVLFICRGNVGRSQFASALLKKMNLGHEVISAGTKVEGKDGTSRHGQLLKDCNGAERVIDVMDEVGVNVRDNARTQLAPEMLPGVDRVIVMSEREHMPEYLNNWPGMVYWDVPDPKGHDVEFHREIREKVDALLKENLSLFLSTT